MTEPEWLASTDLDAMLKALEQPSIRKLRLYAIACCRRIWPEILDDAGRLAVEVAEQHTLGQATDFDLASVCSNTNATFRGIHSAHRGHQGLHAAVAACRGTAEGIIHNHLLAFVNNRHRRQNIPLLRDIFPFRPLAIEPAWRTGTVIALARGIYADAAFDRLPILADALQDADCTDQSILDHCRSEGPHVRGCQVIDALLGLE